MLFLIFAIVSPCRRRRRFAKSIVNLPIACPRNTKIKSRRAAWFRSQVDTHRMWQAREPGVCTANQWFFLDWLSFSQPSGRTGTACGSAFALFIMQLTTRRHLPPQSCIHSQVRIDHTRVLRVRINATGKTVYVCTCVCACLCVSMSI